MQYTGHGLTGYEFHARWDSIHGPQKLGVDDCGGTNLVTLPVSCNW